MVNTHDYKLSKYNVDIKYDGKFYVFNLNSGALVEVTPTEINLLKANSFDLISKDSFENLKSLNLIVQKDVDEYKLLTAAQEKLCVAKNRHFCINIMTTTKCNARCYYCYENAISHKKHMSKETVDQLIKYILSNYNGRTVHLKWFGGEPLCNTYVISKICNELKKLNVNYYSTMISNGLYVGKYLNKIKNDWNFKRIQITLDGIDEKYNSIKNYSVWKGQNHFNILIQNIHALIDNEIFVSIRLNFNPLNYSDCLLLLEYLFKEFGHNKFLQIYCSHIYDENLPLPNNLSDNPYVHIYEKLMSLGYVNSLFDLRIIKANYYCGIKDKEFITVDPDGNLFKCEHEACHGKAHAFSNLFSDNSHINQLNLDMWEKSSTNTLCEECKCYPICNGGCKYYEIHSQNNAHCIQIKNCLSEILKIFIKSEVKTK